MLPPTAVESRSGETTNLLAGNAARQAFEGQDVEASRKYHDTRVSMNSDEHHKSEGGLLKPMIFGGLDGILTSFAIVAGAAGGNLSSGVVLILGFSNILADALAMGVGEFLSSKAENEWILSERRREEWELENYPEGERREMVELYMDKGMSREDAENVIETLAKYKDFFVDIMMTQELGLQVPEEDHVTESIREGVIMFASFAFFGALPLIGYVVFPSVFPTLSENQLFVCACAVTGFVLFFLGSVKSRFCASHWLTSGVETLLLGGLCATVAFSIGQFVKAMIGTE